MFGIRQNNQTPSQRALVPVTEPVEEEDGNVPEGLSERTGFDLRQFFQSRKIRIACIAATAVLLAVVLIVTISVTTRTAAPVINPTTPAPPTTSTTPPTTTSTSTTTTTTKPTTTTTTPTTTTTSTTTTTTTTTPPTTTTPTTTTPSTTTTSTTTTTSKPEPGPVVPTKQPLPPDPLKISAETLLKQIGLTLNYTEVSCFDATVKTFKWILLVEEVHQNFTGESDTKRHARTAASINAVETLFPQINYTGTHWVPPPPPHECRPNGTIVLDQFENDISDEIVSE